MLAKLGTLATTAAAAALVVASVAVGERRVEGLGDVQLVQPEGDLCFDELRRRADRVSLGPGREVVLADAEAPAELPKQLQRGNPVARLDPRDVRGGAPGKREPALAEARRFACATQPFAHFPRIVDVV